MTCVTVTRRPTSASVEGRLEASTQEVTHLEGDAALVAARLSVEAARVQREDL